jgi:fluoride exporter
MGKVSYDNDWRSDGLLARYVAGTAIMERFGSVFPLGTPAVNASGSFLIGLLMTLLTEHLQLHPHWRLLLVVGFLGGYTTFSSFEYETYQAVRDGGLWTGLLNVARVSCRLDRVHDR